ncbi:cupin domain-containing protein [Sphingomonas sp. QA11]|uniref:cupin domain-containing protein n=1 Tax=Sphingomonas sp. QA11 TaxID=2950605 RepID=UPI002349E480|nr:cupin domain-containing protein [Sphingomonas sp. QA11]WCM25970.1 cupin domain-containing protein [Sphingomonas sp. QA11]
MSAARRETGCPAEMTVVPAGTGIVPAPAGIASGDLLVQGLLASGVGGEMTAVRAFFAPGVLSHWHSHPRGQWLFALDGVGLAQRDGGAVVTLRAGDAVWFAPDERHWHGAAPGSPFSYVSVQQVGGGVTVRWMEAVDDRARLEDKSRP